MQVRNGYHTPGTEVVFQPHPNAVCPYGWNNSYGRIGAQAVSHLDPPRQPFDPVWGPMPAPPAAVPRDTNECTNAALTRGKRLSFGMGQKESYHCSPGLIARGITRADLDDLQHDVAAVWSKHLAKARVKAGCISALTMGLGIEQAWDCADKHIDRHLQPVLAMHSARWRDRNVALLSSMHDKKIYIDLM